MTGAAWNSTQEIFRFTRGMLAFRFAHPVLSKEQFYTDAEIQWFGPQGGLPHWADPQEKQFACLIHEDALSSALPDVQFRRSGGRFRLTPRLQAGPAGIWPLTLLAMRRKMFLQMARNRFGKIRKLTTYRPAPAPSF